MDGCNPDLHPDHLENGRPTYKYDDCAMLGSTYRDVSYKFGSNSCNKILREWTVMDWCTYDKVRNPHQGIHKYTQVLKVSVADSPVVLLRLISMSQLYRSHRRLTIANPNPDPLLLGLPAR